MKKISQKVLFILLITIILMLLGIVLFTSFKSKDAAMCLIQFESNGGSEVVAQDIECGSYLNRPDNPVKQGFSFEGWYYNDIGFDFKNTIINEDIILTAKWKTDFGSEIVKVVFDSTGGSNVETIEVLRGNILVPPISPIREGYVFTYWYFNNNRFDFSTPIDNDIVLKAGWQVQQTVNNENNNSIDSNKKPNNSSTDTNSNNTDIVNKKCEYEMRDYSEYNGNPSHTFWYGEETQINPYFGFWKYDYEGCQITYKTDDNEILGIKSSGLIYGKKLGKTNLYICVVEKKIEKELECFKLKANVVYRTDSEKAKVDGENLVKELSGYYWYLDGYQYAYISATVKSWYDHEILSWSSQYIEIIDDKFVASEDTGDSYRTSTTVHNRFLINPIEYSWTLISEYNMHISNDKLYITLGGKTYSFTRSKTKKIPAIKLDKNSIVVDENEEFNITANLYPSFAYHDITYETPWIQVDGGGYVIATCTTSEVSYGTVIFNCMPIHEGVSTITIKDTVSGASSTINIRVNNASISVKSVSLNKEKLTLSSGSIETLNAMVLPFNADNRKVSWSSSNRNVATVDYNGTVVAKNNGTAIITVTTEDGKYQASCEVTVINSVLMAEGEIGYAIITTSSGVYAGITASINPTGGSGVYTYYYIKLYKNDVLIAETTNTSLNEIVAYGHKNGTYTMEYIVKDSEGNEYKGTSGPTTVTM